MMKTLDEATIPWEPARYLESEEAQLAYLALVLEEDEPAEFQEALGIVARTRGMTDVARAADLARDTLYKALRRDGNPSFATILSVLHALGIGIAFKRIDRPAA